MKPRVQFREYRNRTPYRLFPFCNSYGKGQEWMAEMMRDVIGAGRSGGQETLK